MSPTPPAGVKAPKRRPIEFWALVGIGLVSGFFSGLFGIGGGLLVVPALVVLLKVDQRLAVGTSLLAILPAATASALSYASGGSVDWAVAGILALGAILGAQLGAYLMGRISRQAAQWVFVAFVGFMVVQLMLVVPDREAALTLDAPTVAGLLGLGLLAGALSGLLGVGGGGVVVPILMVWFGLGDLVAKGVSLVMMLPGVISGLVANFRLRSVHVGAGLSVGLASILTSPLGAWVAHRVPSQVGAWLFAAFLVFVGVSMAREALRPE